LATIGGVKIVHAAFFEPFVQATFGTGTAILFGTAELICPRSRSTEMQLK
jgi:hypothetical protein